MAQWEPLGVPEVPPSPAGFVLEIDDALRFAVNDLGALRFRLRLGGLPTSTLLAISLQSAGEFGLKEQAPLAFEVGSPLESRLLPLWQCRPSLPGNFSLGLHVEVFGANHEQLGRWQGSLVIRVSRPDSAPQIQVQGDLLNLGDGGLAQSLGLGDAPGAENWRIIPLEPEIGFQTRTRRALPAVRLACPESPRVSEPEPGKGVSGLSLNGYGPTQGQEALVCWGTQASLGRNPGPGAPAGGAHFPVDADDGDPTEGRRISGTHCLVRLHGGRAWVQDVSTNGTWLNGERLRKGYWYLLVPDDLLSLRKVANLKVQLQAGPEGVAAVGFAQRTRAGVTKCFVLASRFLLWPAGGVAGWAEAPSGARQSAVWLLRHAGSLWWQAGASPLGGAQWRGVSRNSAVTEVCGWRIQPVAGAGTEQDGG